jgi:hypothetical protein
MLGEMREERGHCGIRILSGIQGFRRGGVDGGEGGEQVVDHDAQAASASSWTSRWWS